MEEKSFRVGALWANIWRAQGTYYFLSLIRLILSQHADIYIPDCH